MRWPPLSSSGPRQQQQHDERDETIAWEKYRHVFEIAIAAVCVLSSWSCSGVQMPPQSLCSDRLFCFGDGYACRCRIDARVVCVRICFLCACAVRVAACRSASALAALVHLLLTFLPEPELFYAGSAR